MRKLLLILCLTTTTCACYPQHVSPSDSTAAIRIMDEMLALKNTDIKKQDTLIAKAIEVAGQISRKDYQLKFFNLWSALKLQQNEYRLATTFCQKAVDIGNNSNLVKTVWFRDAVTQLTLCYTYLGKQDSCLNTAIFGKALSLSAKDDFNYSILLTLEAITRISTWPPEKVEVLFDSAAKLAKKTVSPHDDMMAGYNKAGFLKIAGKKDWTRSIETLTSLHDIIDHPEFSQVRTKPYERVAFWFRGARPSLYHELSQTYFQLSDLGDACYYQEEIVNDYKRNGNYAYLPYAWSDLAEYETFRNNLPKVKHIYDSCRKLIRQYYKSDEIKLPSFFYAGGWLAEQENDLTKATTLYQKAINAAKPAFHVASLSLFRILAVSGRMEEATRLYHSIQASLENEPLFFYKILFTKEIAAYQRLLGKDQLADKTMLEYYRLKDSMTTAARYYVIRETETRFRTREREKELALLNKEKLVQAKVLQQKTWQVIFLVGGLIFLLLSLALLFWFYKNKKQQTNILRQKNDQIETLIRELHHRVKNNLQVVSSLMSLQSNRLHDEGAREALEEGKTRVDAMAMIHQKLYMDRELASVDMSEYLQNLTISLANSYGFGSENVSTQINLPEKSLDIDRAIPIGLIVNELVTNSFKHGFADVTEPRIEVSLVQHDHRHLELTVADNGTGFKKDEDRRKPDSFGMKLVHTLVTQLKGEMDVLQEQGTVFKIEIRA